MPDLDNIDHVAIAVPDVGAAVAWYRERFRCSVDYQDETWALLRFGNVKLAFVVPEQHPPHIGIVTPAAEAHGPLSTHRDGTRSVYVEDVAGNQVELLAP